MRLLCWLLVLSTSLAGTSVFADGIEFDRHVAPILASHCLDCHSGDAPKGGLSLTASETALKGGESGPVIVTGNSADSLLWQRVLNDEMPPQHPLAESEKQTLRRWIEAGAQWSTSPIDPYAFTTSTRAGRDWWSLQPLREAIPPTIENAGQPWGRNAVDAFVLARLQAAGLQPSPPAEPRDLVRRVYFDLIGLPPSPEQVAAFVTDPSDAAYGQMVDELLASSHYGERWGRHWLDVVRFGESDGFERNHPRDNAWPYRDWVIQALNDDLPYDEFVRRQLIGDLTVGGFEGAAATGFWVAGVHNTVVGGSKRMQQLAREDEIEEVLATVGQTFLGLTVNCARCHHHKFDPITQKEFYQLSSAISGLGYGEREETVVTATPDLQQIVSRLAVLVQNDKDASKSTGDEDSPSSKRRFYTLTPGPGSVVQVLGRGDPDNAGEVVSAAGIASVSGLDSSFGLPPDAPEAERRRQLANWITHHDNPLFARVIVNRVWHHHFGVGLVDTPNDFGFNGGRPTHPELLDYLAVEFCDQGYRLKSLHRRIVMSSAYRQSTHGLAGDARAKALSVDVENRLYWRGVSRRLDAESLRDAMLSVAGKLNPQAGGPGYRDVSVTLNNGTTYYEPLDVDGDEYFRRTIYRFTPRGGRSSLLDTFDCPDPSATAPRRSVTTTPLQALSLLNNSFVLRMSQYLAQRVEEKTGKDVSAQARRCWERVLLREPSEEELQLSVDLIEQHGLEALCRGLFNASEFVVIE